MLQDIVKEMGSLSWEPYEIEPGYFSRSQMGFDGSEGPEFIRASFPHRAIPPHFHRGAQFQLLLRGTLEFPDRRMDAIAVHYTDHNVPYGPFRTGAEHDMIVVHPVPAGIQGMPDVRRHPPLGEDINTHGRDWKCSAHEVEWQPVVGISGARRKLLGGVAGGPSAEIIECEAGCAMPASASPFGRYEYVFRGSATLRDRNLPAETMRFAKGDELAPGLVAGPEGATLIVMIFDADGARSHGGRLLDPFPDYLRGKALKPSARLAAE